MEAKGAAPPPPNPNPDRPAFLAGVSDSGPPPLKPMLAFYFLRALSRIRGVSVTPVRRRTRTIRRAAYISMARAASPRRAWSRALLRQERARRSITSRRAAMLVRRRVGGGAALATAARSIGTTAGETSAAAAPLAPARRRQAGEPPRTDALRRLVPGGAGMEYCSLLEETADYVRCLRAQVQLMQGLADLVSSCQ